MPFTLPASTIWRQYITDGESASGAHAPKKAEIITWGGEVEDQIEDLLDAVRPMLTVRRVPVPFTGTLGQIPAGWQLCDGSNGTPDLRNRFLMGGGDDYALGSTGGRTSFSEIINHSHGSGNYNTDQHNGHNHGSGNYGTNTTGGHSHEILGEIAGRGTGNADGLFSLRDRRNSNNNLSREQGISSNEGNHSHNVNGTSSNAGAHDHEVYGNSSSTGNTNSINIVNPYYAVAWIIRVS